MRPASRRRDDTSCVIGQTHGPWRTSRQVLDVR